MIDLDDIEIREAVTGNLASVIGGAIPLCIDEYQRVPDVLDAIKARLNREGSRPGVAVITGSTRQDALPRAAQALTGRLHTVTIWPLSQGELAASHENLLEGLHADPDTTVAQYPASDTAREEYVARVCANSKTRVPPEDHLLGAVKARSAAAALRLARAPTSGCQQRWPSSLISSSTRLSRPASGSNAWTTCSAGHTLRRAPR